MSSAPVALSYRVLYAKAGAKKRKLFSDGFLHIKEGSGNSFLVSLTSEDGCDLRKSSEKNIMAFKVGEEAAFGSFIVQIEESVGGINPASVPATVVAPVVRPSAVGSFKNSNFRAPSSTFNAPTSSINRPAFPSARAILPAPLPPVVEDVCDHDTFWDNVQTFPAPTPGQINIASHKSSVTAPPETLKQDEPAKGTCPQAPKPFTSSNLVRKKPAVSNTVEQDPSLMKLMRPHQIVGANFLISRLLNEPSKSADSEPAAASTDEGEDDVYSDADCTGGILADEMGVGKTLTAISVVWAFVRKGGRKALIVCPSSLVDNWIKEIKHWLGTKLKPLTLKAGADAGALINTFAISMATLYPVMVLSYEMFRKHAALLNTVPGLELIVCDEGHRLKNIGGTKTMQALSGCKAFRRVILSGTPIQNDLEELYAVVSFVAPGYLGTLSEYKSRIAQPISRGSEADATALDREQAAAASDLLRRLLGKIMLRRTQSDILSTLLPPRSDYVVYCQPCPAQAAEYAAVAQDIQRSLGLGSTPLEALDLDDEALEDSHSTATSSSAAGSMILPGLQNLRRICSSGGSLSGGGSGGGGRFASARELVLGQQREKENLNGNAPSTAATLPSRGVGNLGGKAQTGAPMSLGGRSTKLQVLASFISNLRKLCPDEKIVVVSNFTTALDDVEALAKGRNWGAILRLDGRVPVDQRQALVNRFNRPDDESFLFLLSAKAGGVGINLIGASRLVMFDVDWNPAVDLQAMSRVWREGQCRPVHVYRLIMAGTIEDAILQRQRSKRDLAHLVEGGEDAGACDSGIGALGRKGGSEKRMSLTRKDVLQLLYPGLYAQVLASSIPASALGPAARSARAAGDCTSGAGRGNKWGRIQCSDDDESVSGRSESGAEADLLSSRYVYASSDVERGDDGTERELQLADVLPSPSSCSTYAEDPAGIDLCNDNLTATTSAGCGKEGGDSNTEKAITDAVLLATVAQLGASVIIKATCVE